MDQQKYGKRAENGHHGEGHDRVGCRNVGPIKTF